MYVKVGGGVAYQPDCTSLYDRVPEELRVELYADDAAELVLNEGEGVTNRFACKKAGDTYEITAENNSAVDRTYTVVVYADREYPVQFLIKAGARKTHRA